MSNIEPLGGTTLDVTPADVSDELGRAGAAFGDLVRLTGKAVADTQRKLNKTGAATTSALASTLVDVIAVTETIYDEDGTLTESKSHTLKLPLITFVDPVVYEWSEVRLQGRFFARELGTASGSSSSSGSSSDGSGQAGIGIVFGFGYTSFGSRRNSVESEVNANQDLSMGELRMSADLRPRRDIGVPKPREAMQGPQLAILPGEIQDVAAAGANPAQRTMTVTFQYFKRDGSPIQGRQLAIETDGVPWDFDGGANATDAAGKLSIKLRRVFLDPEADTSPEDVVVTGRKGLVNNSTTVTF